MTASLEAEPRAAHPLPGKRILFVPLAGARDRDPPALRRECEVVSAPAGGEPPPEGVAPRAGGARGPGWQRSGAHA
jgi:hypothetical protein